MKPGKNVEQSRLPCDHLVAGLVQQGLGRERAEALVHALVDIRESMEKIYGTLLPKLIAVLDHSPDEFMDKLWDIREEFRHVDYHIHDSGITEL